jgi:hypothetical protein
MSLFGRLLGRQKNSWDEFWQTYPGDVGGAPATWSVDLGAVSAAPIAQLPVRMDVEVDLAAGPDGLPADGARLVQLEDAVRASAASLGGSYLGRVASRGACRFTAHLPAAPAEPVAVPAAPHARVRTEYDPHWAYVRDTLAPDDRQQRLIEDLAVVGVLSGHGDPLATPRDVEHCAFFAEQAPAEQAAADLRSDGFLASVERDDEGDFALIALRSDPVAPPRVHELVWAVKETVERHGGTYDSWACGLAQAA